MQILWLKLKKNYLIMKFTSNYIGIVPNQVATEAPAAPIPKSLTADCFHEFSSLLSSVVKVAYQF